MDKSIWIYIGCENCFPTCEQKNVVHGTNDYGLTPVVSGEGFSWEI